MNFNERRAQGLIREQDLLEADAAGWYVPDESLDEIGRQELEWKLYRLMQQWGVKPLLRLKTDSLKVKVNGEFPTRRWLKHYYNLRSVQPCFFVAAKAANRMTGEDNRDDDEMPPRLDHFRLFHASQIFLQERREKTKKKGQTNETVKHEIRGLRAGGRSHRETRKGGRPPAAGRRVQAAMAVGRRHPSPA